MKRAITGQTYEKGGVWDPCIEIWHQLLKDLGWRATGVLLKAVGIRNVVNFSQIKNWSIFSLDIVEPGGVFSTYICVIGSHWPPAEWFNICETRCFRGDRGNVTFCNPKWHLLASLVTILVFLHCTKIKGPNCHLKQFDRWMRTKAVHKLFFYQLRGLLFF